MGRDLTQERGRLQQSNAHVFEAKLQPAKLMQVINPVPWVKMMHDSSIKRGRIALFTILRRRSNHSQPYHAGQLRSEV